MATSVALCISLSSPPQAGAAPDPDPNQGARLIKQVNTVLGLRDSSVVALELPALPGPALTVGVSFQGREFLLDMEPHSVRNQFSYELRSQQADGSWVVHDPGPVLTLRGVVLGMPGSRVAGSLLEDGLHATFMLGDGTKYWVEPLGDRVPGARANDHAVYRDIDVIPSDGICGTNDMVMVEQFAPAARGDNSPLQGGAFSCTDVGVDADFEFFAAHGATVAGTQARIELVINTMNLQYETQVQISHLISTLLVRTVGGAPYTDTSAGGLLSQFQSEWNTNQAGVLRDVAHLFTGKNLQGGTIGIAFLGVVCSTFNAYSLVQSDCCGSLACSTDLSAHELGHNWAAPHCDPCSTTMRSFIGCFNNFGANTINTIVGFRNSRACLVLCSGPESGTTTLPFFDDFSAPPLDPTLWTGVDGAVVDTQGIGEPSPTQSMNIDTNDAARTAIMDTSLSDFVTVSYWWQRTGGGNSTEADDDLFVEYMNDLFQWTVINQHLGSGADMTTYQFETVNLPADAKHDSFRLRFRATGTTGGNFDDWYVDDVSVITPPSNNSCASSLTILAGANPFSTVAATSTGFTEGCANLDSDIWFNYIATCTGTLDISICDADFDTELAVYSFVCPVGPNESLFCNQDSCGTGSAISVPISPGFFRIRIGGQGGQTGTGTLNITCTEGVVNGACCHADGTCTDGTSADCTTSGGTYQGDGTTCATASCPQPCLGDIAPPGGNGVVNIDDLIALLGVFGPCVGCPEDITPPGGNGVVNIDDLVALLGAFGSCP